MISQLKFLMQNPKASKFALGSLYNGYLKDVGWLRSFNEGKCVDLAGNHLPWLAYPAIDFLSERLPNDADVFEYGSGASTQYFAKRARSVTSVEHSQPWFEQCQKSQPANCQIYFRAPTDPNGYASAVGFEGKPYDLIVVDGIERPLCVAAAPSRLTARGAIIVDDSERDEYGPCLQELETAGFKRLNFWGVAPLIQYKKCTSLFYKDQNLFGL